MNRQGKPLIFKLWIATRDLNLYRHLCGDVKKVYKAIFEVRMWLCSSNILNDIVNDSKTEIALAVIMI